MISKTSQFRLAAMEIALSIGNNFDLKAMLKESLLAYLKRLNCTAAGVFRLLHNESKQFRYEHLHSIPRTATDRILPAVNNLIPTDIDRHTLDTFCERLPIMEWGGHHAHIHLLELPGFGLIYLVKKNSALDPMLLKSLAPINRKLANACRSCIQQEELHDTYRQLEAEITSRKQANRVLQESQNLFDKILSTMSDGILVLDRKCQVRYCNRALEFFTHVSLEELFGGLKQPWEALPGRDMKTALKQVIGGETIAKEDVPYQRPDGKSGYLCKVYMPLRDTEGCVDGVLGIFRDMTDRMARETILKEKEAAEMANQAKSEFLANMSHELRTPMHGILSFASLGKKRWQTAKSEKLRDYFTRIETSGQILLELLNDLLDLAKLEAGKMTFELAEWRLGEVVALVVDEFESILSDQDIQLVFEKDVAETVVTLDKARMAQLVRNILTNAVKFSPAGGTIRVSLKHQNQQTTVAIQDQGPGIPEEELESVFDKFVQSSKTRTTAGGTGLGLAICKEIVEAHRGMIWAENHPTGGTVFQFTIPDKTSTTVHDVEHFPSVLSIPHD